MSIVYLFRHGQAGTRDNYDRLSEKGCRQAQLLGEHLCASGLRFRAAYAGSLERQRQTAALALGSVPDAPPIQTDDRWNEFNLEGLWRHLAPVLMRENPEFRSNYDRLHRNHPNIDRVMTVCDADLIRAWTSGKVCDGIESWSDFRSRVAAPAAELSRYGEDDTIAVFTSATPTALWTGMSLDLNDRGVMRVLGVLINTSFSSYRVKYSAATLLSFNNTPHLRDPELKTLR